MKKILSMLIVGCMLLSVGCDNGDFVAYPHEYEGIVETRIKSNGVVVGSRYTSNNAKIIYQVDCSKDNSGFNKIIFNSNDGDEDFKMFLMQNVGRKVKINVNVITREGDDHEASYGTVEIINYEVIK